MEIKSNLYSQQAKSLGGWGQTVSNKDALLLLLAFQQGEVSEEEVRQIVGDYVQSPEVSLLDRLRANVSDEALSDLKVLSRKLTSPDQAPVYGLPDTNTGQEQTSLSVVERELTRDFYGIYYQWDDRVRALTFNLVGLGALSAIVFTGAIVFACYFVSQNVVVPSNQGVGVEPRPVGLMGDAVDDKTDDASSDDSAVPNFSKEDLESELPQEEGHRSGRRRNRPWNNSTQDGDTSDEKASEDTRDSLQQPESEVEPEAEQPVPMDVGDSDEASEIEDARPDAPAAPYPIALPTTNTSTS